MISQAVLPLICLTKLATHDGPEARGLYVASLLSHHSSPWRSVPRLFPFIMNLLRSHPSVRSPTSYLTSVARLSREDIGFHALPRLY